MNIWKIYWNDLDDRGQQIRWRSNQRDAKHRLNRAKKEHREAFDCDPEPCGITPVDIPTTKFELVDWLNNNLTEDNG